MYELSQKTVSKGSPDGLDGQFWVGYGLLVDLDDVDHGQVISIIARTNFGFMNFLKNCTQGVPRWSKWPIWPSYDSHVDEADKFDSRSVIPTESVRLHDDAKVQSVVHSNLFS